MLHDNSQATAAANVQLGLPLNFWMMLPIAAGCYGWLMRDRLGLLSSPAPTLGPDLR